METVVCSPLIGLAHVGGLPWLHALFGELRMPPEVRANVIGGRGLPVSRPSRHPGQPPRPGPLPAAITDRLAQANAEQLDLWAERILDADGLDEVFAGN